MLALLFNLLQCFITFIRYGRNLLFYIHVCGFWITWELQWVKWYRFQLRHSYAHSSSLLAIIWDQIRNVLSTISNVLSLRKKWYSKAYEVLKNIAYHFPCIHRCLSLYWRIGPIFNSFSIWRIVLCTLVLVCFNLD